MPPPIKEYDKEPSHNERQKEEEVKGLWPKTTVVHNSRMFGPSNPYVVEVLPATNELVIEEQDEAFIKVEIWRASTRHNN